jgi:signal recognition particle subunit SEC65
MYSEEVVKTKYSCQVCKKTYTRKISLERHNILCDLKTRSKVELTVEEEEANDKPTYDQLVKIVQELSIKYFKMEEKVNEMQQWIDRKKKKVDIVTWLNANINSTVGFLEWINIIINVLPEHFIYLMEYNVFQTFQQVFEYNLTEKKGLVCPIKCFSQKNNVFYICENTEEGNSIWREMELTDFTQLIKKIHNKLLFELTEWKKKNHELFNDNSKISDQFNKAVIKLMSIGFTQDTNMSRIKTTLYNYLKVDVNCGF